MANAQTLKVQVHRGKRQADSMLGLKQFCVLYQAQVMVLLDLLCQCCKLLRAQLRERPGGGLALKSPCWCFLK